MSAGCVVVSTDLPGIEDLIADGASGFVVRQADAGEIADRLLQVLAAPERLDAMKRRAREVVVAQFDWRVIAARFADVLRAAYYSGAPGFRPTKQNAPEN